MQGVARFVWWTAAVVVLVVAVVFLISRFSDGPLGIVAGGPFSSGERYEGPEPDWSFVHDVREIELQLMDPPRSRTTWIVEHDGRAYLACGYMRSFLGGLWKRWPHEAARDGRALLRIDGRVYPRELVRIEEGPLVQPILERLNEKYVGADQPMSDEAVRSGEIWLFALSPRA